MVEDDNRLCSAIVAYLESHGVRTFAAATMQEAVSTLEKGEVCLVVLDLELVNSAGLATLRHIRESPDLAHLPVLVLSSWDMDPMCFDYLKPGNYLLKPFDMRMLDLMILQLLERRQDRNLRVSKAASVRSASV